MRTFTYFTLDPKTGSKQILFRISTYSIGLADCGYQIATKQDPKAPGVLCACQ